MVGCYIVVAYTGVYIAVNIAVNIVVNMIVYMIVVYNMSRMRDPL